MPDDFSADITTTGSILIDGSANGEIELVGDQDWFEVLLVEDQRYRVEITGLYSGGGDTLADPFLRGVYDQTGTFVPFVIDDDETASERNTVLEFVAGASGIHFLAASGYNQSVGTYSISIADLGPDDDYSADVFTTGTAFPGSSSFGTFEFAGDQDWFKIYLNGGIRYQFQLFGDGTGAWADASNLILGELHDENGDPIPASGETAGENSGFVASPVQSFFEYVAPADGYYFINASTFQGSTGQYQLDVTDLGYIDDHPADDTTSATVAINGSVMAEIEAHGDKDWISVLLLAGNVYDITVTGGGTGLGSLPTPNITGIYDGQSTMVPYSFAGDGLNGSATLRYVAPGTGSYFISVGSFNDDIGTYTVSVTNPFPVDDHGDNASTESQLSVGVSQMGLIGHSADVDVFQMSLTAGQVYQIDMIGTELVSPLDTFIDGIYSYPSYFDYDFPNNLIAGTADDNSGLDANSRVIFTAPFTGDFFLSASGAGGDTGAYDVILSVLGLAADDFGDDINTLGTLAVGGSVFGANEIESDQDWFAMTLQAGQVYRLTAVDDLSNRGDFSAMSLRIFDQLGVEVSDGIINMPGQLESEIEFAPDTSGTYYAVVGDDSLVNGTGHYNLGLQDLGSVDDYTDDITTTGNFFYNGTDHTHVLGEITLRSRLVR